MVAATKTVEVEPDTELDRLLDEAGERPLILIRSGVRYRVVREMASSGEHGEPLAADYNADRLMEEARSIAGIITPEEAEAWIANIYRWREEGSRPPDRP